MNTLLKALQWLKTFFCVWGILTMFLVFYHGWNLKAGIENLDVHIEHK